MNAQNAIDNAARNGQDTIETIEKMAPTPETVTVDPYKNVPQEIRDKTNEIETADHRVEMVAKIKLAVSRIPNYINVLADCAVGDAFHPGKLADALRDHIPSNWETALRDDVDKSPQEQLAGIVAGFTRTMVTTQANELAREYGLSKDDQTRALKKAIRSKAMDTVSRVVPVRVAKASTAEYQDNILAGLRAIINK